jgi:hypothetical protein
MILRRIFATTAILLGLSAAAHADTLSASAMYGGPTQSVAACYITNFGTGTVSIVSHRIQLYIAGGPMTNVPLTFDQCGATLAANSSCSIATGIAAGTPYSCTFVLSPSAADVRGVFQLRAGNSVLQSMELR